MNAGKRHVPGALLFARYAFPPNALGYCGPPDAGALLEYASSGQTDRGLAALAQRFDGAWPYLALIAAANRRADPLDADVVRAYWLGGPLLESVPPELLAAQLDERFARRIGRSRDDLATAARTGGRAHHNFHVFAVYPWVGMLRAGKVREPLRVLDACRIAWGTVQAVDGAMATVASQPLLWTGSELVLGPPRPRRAVLAAGGRGLVPSIRVGDRVSLHWDWVCDVLDDRDRTALSHYTRSQLDIANHALARPIVAAVLD